MIFFCLLFPATLKQWTCIYLPAVILCPHKRFFGGVYRNHHDHSLVHLSVCRLVHLSVHPSACLSIPLSVHPSACLSIPLSVHPSACLSIPLPVCPPLCLPVHMFHKQNSLRNELMLMELYLVVVYNLWMCIKEDNPCPKYIKGDY